MPQNLKLKVLTLITKLSDRDTYTTASTELEKMAVSLDNTTLSTFLSCILSTDSTDKPLVRKHCLHLLSTLSLLYSNSLSNSLPKILSYVTRRLRDPDSSVIRSHCLTTITSLASKITKLPFSTAFFKQLSESVFTEQELNAQIGSALCLASAIDAAPDPEPARLGKLLVPKLERLVRSEGYKAKFAVLVVLGSVIGVGGVRAIGGGGIGGLVKCLVGFLSSEDWNSRKAAAEALKKLAVVERDGVAEFKSECLKVFENRRFDKVKAAREVMNETIEAWKQVPDLSEEASPPPRSLASSREDASEGCHRSGYKNFCAAGSEAHQMRKKSILAIRTTPPDSSLATTARKRGPLKSVDKKTSPAMHGKVDQKKPVDWKVEISARYSISSTAARENDLKEKTANVPEIKFAKPETKRALFGKNSDDKTLKFGGFKSGPLAAPCHEESPQSTVVASSGTENHHSNQEFEDLSLIRNQLVQIERQQSSLLDLLQSFIGSSQNGMHSLETRVHGLELALDKISYDLAESSGRMTNTDSNRTTCCLLPGADFLSSKLWRKREGRYSNSRISSSRDNPLSAAVRHRADRNDQPETINLGNQRLRLQSGGGFIVNSLAEIHGGSRANSAVTQQ